MKWRAKWSHVVIVLGLIAALAIASPAFGISKSIKKAIKREVAKQIGKATGPAGANGTNGANGAIGTARGYARVLPPAAVPCNQDGGSGCHFDHDKGVAAVTHTGSGAYCVTAPGISPDAIPAAVSVDLSTTPASGNASAIVDTESLCTGDALPGQHAAPAQHRGSKRRRQRLHQRRGQRGGCGRRGVHDRDSLEGIPRRATPPTSPAGPPPSPCASRQGRRLRRGRGMARRGEVLLDLLDGGTAAEALEVADELHVGEVAGGQRVRIAAAMETEALDGPWPDLADLRAGAGRIADRRAAPGRGRPRGRSGPSRPTARRSGPLRRARRAPYRRSPRPRARLGAARSARGAAGAPAGSAGSSAPTAGRSAAGSRRRARPRSAGR